MSLDLKNKVVVITGASSGLGRELANQLSELGSRLAIIAQDDQAIQQAASDIGDLAKAYVCDVSDLTQVQKTIQDIRADYGRIDILINNAGIWTDNELEKKDPAHRQKVFEVNSLGVINVTNEVLPIMQDARAGHIFNVISTAGEADTLSGDNTNWHTYGASKWAVTGFTRALTKQLNDSPIRVTSFHPGGFESDLYEGAYGDNAHNQPWMMRTKDVAEIVVFALTRPADVQIERLLVTKKQANHD